MVIDWPKLESWYDANQELEKSLGFPKDGVSLRLFQGLQMRLLEVCLGLAQVFPHRKIVATHKKFTPFFDAVSVQLSKRGFKVEDLSELSQDQITEFFSANKKDLLLCLSSIDDPCLGVLSDTHGHLKEQSEKARIFFVESSSLTQSFEATEVGKRSIRLVSIDSKTSIGLYGAKVQIKEFIAPSMDWSKFIIDEISESLNTRLEDEKKVVEFEKLGIEGSKPLLSGNENRTFDRALIYWEDLDSSALLGALAAKGISTSLSSASLCHWNDRHVWKYLLEREYTEDQLRGLLVIPVSSISDELTKNLSQSVNEVRSMQSFSS